MRTANRFFNLIVAISIALGLVMLPAPQHTVQAASDLRISQVYGGNSNAISPYKYDYIELYNAGSSAVSLTGYSVQYASATGNTWQVTSLSGSVAAGGYYLVQEASGTGIADLTTPDATGTINLSGTNGKVALASSTTALSGTNPSGGSLVDLVGFGTANGFEGTAAAPAPSTTTSIFRKLNGCTDTDNNSADFETGAPAPRNSASATNTCSGNQLPSVLSSVPAKNATNVAADATLTVVFSEPVTLAADWFSLTCGGTPVAFTEDATSAPTYVMTPTSGLPLAANCTATVSAAKVTDADAAAMSSDYVINFATVGACPVPTNLQEIHTVQGNGATSPLVGQVVTVRGIVTADFQMIFSSTNHLRANGHSQAEIEQMVATRRAVDDYMRGTGSREAAQALIDRAKTQPWFKYLYMGETVRDRSVSGWRREIENDPLTNLTAVTVPALVLYGANDAVVPVAESTKRLAAVAPSRAGPFDPGPATPLPGSRSTTNKARKDSRPRYSRSMTIESATSSNSSTTR